MNTNALFKIGYVLYILSCHENGKDNACIVNTVMQVTSNPCKIAICVNKNNQTIPFPDYNFRTLKILYSQNNTNTKKLLSK